MQTTEPYSLSLFWRDGILTAAQRETKTVFRDEAGVVLFEQANPAEPIPLDLGEEILGEVNAGLLARIAELEATIAGANTSPGASHLLTDLDEAFETLVPTNLHASFEPAWVIVRVLIQVGKLSRAAAFVRALPVPDEMVAIRAQIAEMIDGGN
jgi:hypothetical protein